MISSDSHIIGRLYGNRVLVAKKPGPDSPDSSEQKAVEQLRSRDKEVRAHEASHSSNPELIKIGSAQFDYTIGPDGKAYATGGKVTLSTGSSTDPEDALRKAQALKKASMAPGEPSSRDFQTLNAAAEMEQEAISRIYNEKKNVKSERTDLAGTRINLYA